MDKTQKALRVHRIDGREELAEDYAAASRPLIAGWRNSAVTPFRQLR